MVTIMHSAGAACRPSHLANCHEQPFKHSSSNILGSSRRVLPAALYVTPGLLSLHCLLLLQCACAFVAITNFF